MFTGTQEKSQIKDRLPFRSIKSVLWNNPFLNYPYVLLSLVNYKAGSWEGKPNLRMMGRRRME